MSDIIQINSGNEKGRKITPLHGGVGKQEEHFNANGLSHAINNTLIQTQQRMQPTVDIGPYAWVGGWPEHIPVPDTHQGHHVLQMSSIAPNMLRPALGLRSMSMPMAHQQSHSKMLDLEEMNQVKFVNSTVENLQNQIKREEAPKKKRTRTSAEQLKILQKAFNTDPMPNSSARITLAKKLGMNARAVQVWFQNRRAKEKLEVKRGDSIDSSKERNLNLMGDPMLLHQNNQNNAHNRHHQNHQMQQQQQQQQYKEKNNLMNKQRFNSLPMDNGDSNHPLYDLGLYFSDQNNLAYTGSCFDPLSAYYNPLEQPAFFNDVNDHLPSTAQGIVDGFTIGTEPGHPRFQSMPTVIPNQDFKDFSNSLGIIFDPVDMIRDVGCEDDDGDNNIESSSQADLDHQQGSHYYQRSNSLDVLNIMSDAAVMDSQNQMNQLNLHHQNHMNQHQNKIFSTPQAREAFLTAPFGQSIPMPMTTKQRSLSVPSLKTDMMLPFGLHSIREEDHLQQQNHSTEGLIIPVKRPSNSGIPSSMCGFPGIPGMTGLDQMQAYLDETDL